MWKHRPVILVPGGGGGGEGGLGREFPGQSELHGDTLFQKGKPTRLGGFSVVENSTNTRENLDFTPPTLPHPTHTRFLIVSSYIGIHGQVKRSSEVPQSPMSP